MSIITFTSSGNGKRHRTPLPERPKRIKRITLEAFLRIKELLRGLKRPGVNRRYVYRKKPLKIYKRADAGIQGYKNTYEPSNINATRDSLFWSWRRVVEWEKYINDPLENKNGHKTMV